jgi:DNA-binding LacI/PurR family transcriptional regulator
MDLPEDEFGGEILSEQPKITIKELSEKLGISKTALYLYFKDPATTRLGAEMKSNIEKLLDGIEFHPNVNAQSFSSGVNRTIAMLIPLAAPHFRNTMIDELLSGIQTVLFSKSYKMIFIPPSIIYPTSGSFGILREQVKAASGYDACILFGTRASTEEDMHMNVKYILKTRMPFVVVNMPELPYPINQVVNITPQPASGTKLLLSMGHRRILFMGGTTNAPDTISAFSEYKSLLEEFGLPVDKKLVVNGGYERATARSEFSRTIKDKIDFSAVYCLSDTMALGVYEAAADNGIHIPKDISVIGKDDAQFATVLRPKLTTIKVPAYETGKVAAQLILDAIEEQSHPRHIILDNELIIRESVTPFDGVIRNGSSEGGKD